MKNRKMKRLKQLRRLYPNKKAIINHSIDLLKQDETFITTSLYDYNYYTMKFKFNCSHGEISVQLKIPYCLNLSDDEYKVIIMPDGKEASEFIKSEIYLAIDSEGRFIRNMACTYIPTEFISFYKIITDTGLIPISYDDDYGYNTPEYDDYTSILYILRYIVMNNMSILKHCNEAKQKDEKFIKERLNAVYIGAKELIKADYKF